MAFGSRRARSDQCVGTRVRHDALEAQLVREIAQNVGEPLVVFHDENAAAAGLPACRDRLPCVIGRSTSLRITLVAV